MTALKKTAKSTIPAESRAIAEQERPGSTPVAEPAAARKSTKVAVKTVKAAKRAGKKASSAPALNTKLSSSPGKQKSSSDRVVSPPDSEKAQVLDSEVAYEGPLFRVFRDRIIEPGGREARRDVIRHNGSVVILAVDPAKRKKDPWIVIERQFRYAAGQFLWELPAGKLDAGEAPIEGAKRELAEETGYGAKKWSPLVEYFASPGFLGESMKVFLAEGLIAGDAHPEEDEQIDFRLVRLSDLLEMIDKGRIKDGKTLTTILLYARMLSIKRKK